MLVIGSRNLINEYEPVLFLTIWELNRASPASIDCCDAFKINESPGEEIGGHIDPPKSKVAFIGVSTRVNGSWVYPLSSVFP